MCVNYMEKFPYWGGGNNEYRPERRLQAGRLQWSETHLFVHDNSIDPDLHGEVRAEPRWQGGPQTVQIRTTSALVQLN